MKRLINDYIVSYEFLEEKEIKKGVTLVFGKKLWKSGDRTFEVYLESYDSTFEPTIEVDNLEDGNQAFDEWLKILIS